MRKLLFILFVVSVSLLHSQNALRINSSTINISNGAYINCKADILLENTAKFINNGEILLEKDWVNNSTDSALLGNGIGKVVLYGDTQNIEGLNITKFYRLELQGNNQKVLKLNTIVSDSLILNNIEFATDSFKLFVTSTDTGIISRTSGFISSLDTGYLSRNTNLAETYLFPVGSNSGTARYQAVEITPSNTNANSYSVRFANVNATNEGFDINNKEASIGNINPFWYHRINHTTGTSTANVSIYKALIGDEENMAHWSISGVVQWTNVAPIISDIDKITVQNWNDFDTPSFILTTKKPIVQANNDTTICEGENLQLNVNIISSEGGPYAYYWTPLTYLDDSSIVNPYATGILDSTEYIVQVFDSAAMAMSYPDTVFVSVNPIYNEVDAASICSGDTLFWGNDTLTLGGGYAQTFSSVNGCDSTVVMTLTENLTHEINNSETICSNDSLEVGGGWQNTSGIYYDYLLTSLGCDSVIITDLTVNQAHEIDSILSVCDSIQVGGEWQNTSGVYYDSLLTSTGCDSIIVFDLTVNPSYIIDANISICDGDSILLEGDWQKVAGIYTDSLLTLLGCDSITITNLYVNPIYTQTIDTAICSNDSIYLEGAWQNTSGNYVDVFTSSIGCDSTINTNLTVLSSPIVTISPDTIICNGGSSIISAGGGSHYIWSTGETTSSIIVNPGVTTTYEVTVSIAICLEYASSTVSIYQEPIAVDDTVYANQNDVNIIKDISINDTYIYAHYEILNDVSNGVVTVQVNGISDYTPNEYYFGEDSFTYRLTDSICLNYFDEATVYYIINNNEALLIPNAITPNGDGIHDYFSIGGLVNYPDNELVIFNRWGNEIYSSKPYKNDWNGTGKDGVTILPNGTYYYVLKLNDSENKSFSGYIELVK